MACVRGSRKVILCNNSQVSGQNEMHFYFASFALLVMWHIAKCFVGNHKPLNLKESARSSLTESTHLPGQ